MGLTCYGLVFIMWCEAAQSTVPVDSFCQLYEPVYLSHADTRATKEQADKLNQKWKAICRGAK